MNLRSLNYRYAEEILNSKYSLKREIEDVLRNTMLPEWGISRPDFNTLLEEKLTKLGWVSQEPIFGNTGYRDTRLDFYKDRVGVEVQFGHASFIGIDLLKFQVASYSGLDKIDVAIYVVATSSFIKAMNNAGQKWDGSLSYEKIEKYLPHFRSAIHVPILVWGIEN